MKEQENWKGLNTEAREKPNELKDIQVSTYNNVSYDCISSTIISQDFSLTNDNNTNETKDNTNKENIYTNAETRKIKAINVKKKPLSENKCNKQRGKYLKSRADINLTYDRPLRKRKDEILRNGNNSNLVIVNDKKLYVKHTCAFDSLVEILTTSYCNYSKFKNWIDKNSENIFLSFIKKYATEGVNNSLYQKRDAIYNLRHA